MTTARLTSHLAARWRKHLATKPNWPVYNLIVDLLIRRISAKASVSAIMFSAHWTLAVMDVRDGIDSDTGEVIPEAKLLPRTIDWEVVEEECENYALVLFDADFADAVEDVRAPIEEGVA